MMRDIYDKINNAINIAVTMTAARFSSRSTSVSQQVPQNMANQAHNSTSQDIAGPPLALQTQAKAGSEPSGSRCMHRHSPQVNSKKHGVHTNIGTEKDVLSKTTTR
jgi:hypothetical protein